MSHQGQEQESCECPETSKGVETSTSFSHDQAGDTGERKRRKRQASGSKSGTTPGLVYLSSIPPFMKPHKVRHLLSQYGEVGRVYLQPEDESVRQRRIKFKGNKKVKYTEGWVEFLDRRVARGVAATLNCTPVAHKKKSIYHDDLWNIKYLPKFKWTHLTEKIAYQQAVREQRMRTEISQAKKETTHYLSSVEKRKEISAIVDRKKRKGVPVEEPTASLQRSFKQRPVSEPAVPVSIPSAGEGRLSDSLLRKVFT